MNDNGRALLARYAVDGAKRIREYEDVLAHMDFSTSEKERWTGWIEHHRLAIGDVEALLPDRDLLAAYQRTDGEPGNPEADALLAEIERRGLDV